MRVIVIGATGNVGTSVLGALGLDDRVESIVGVARRVPETELPKVSWRSADVSSSDLDAVVKGADAVVHLAWLIQPSYDVAKLQRVNVDGSRRVFDAVARNNVPTLVYASSIGAYSPCPKGAPVDESWPTGGIHTSAYSMQKAAVERLLDRFEAEHPHVRVVRLRPGLTFKGDSAEEVRRYFLGPLVPTSLLRPGRLPVVPDIPGLRTQAVHTSDVAEAYRSATLNDVHGAFNIAAEPVIDCRVLARILGARTVKVPGGPIRPLIEASWKLHLQPTAAGWLDMGLQTPTMEVQRAMLELDWKPEVSADAALKELIDGFAAHRAWATPPLQRHQHLPGT
jgi:UDP-glucose 4-epimerase